MTTKLQLTRSAIHARTAEARNAGKGELQRRYDAVVQSTNLAANGDMYDLLTDLMGRIDDCPVVGAVYKCGNSRYLVIDSDSSRFNALFRDGSSGWHQHMDLDTPATPEQVDEWCDAMGMPRDDASATDVGSIVWHYVSDIKPPKNRPIYVRLVDDDSRAIYTAHWWPATEMFNAFRLSGAGIMISGSYDDGCIYQWAEFEPLSL